MNNTWYKRRTYKHFDKPICESKAIQLVSNEKNIISHSFYPFINYNFEVRKYNYKDNKKLPAKTRPIMYASHKDSHIYSYYSSLLATKYENFISDNNLNNNVIAYRKLIPPKCNIDFAFEAFDEIKSRGKGCVIASYISKYFDTINHDLLKEHWCSILNVDNLPEDHYKIFKQITKFSYIEYDKMLEALEVSKSKFRKQRNNHICSPKTFRARLTPHIIKNEKSIGIPQGSPISAILSNIYLMNFDLRIKDNCESRNAYYRRYCDDILIICDINNEEYFKSLIYSNLSTYELDCSMKKEKISNFETINGAQNIDRAVQYLGFEYNGKNILIRSSTLSRYKRKTLKAVKMAFNSAFIRKAKKIHKQKIYSFYSHLQNISSPRSNLNFYSYVRKTDLRDIKKQVKKHWVWTNNLVTEYESKLLDEVYDKPFQRADERDRKKRENISRK
ncbi:reverse transcriptase/maturase family protein [bacterium]|nr:reverse transcriptase/maturase family protein [bacterium]